MNKQKLSQMVLLSLYNNNGFDKSIDEMAEIIAGDINLNKEKVKDILYKLKSKSAFLLDGDKIIENKKVTKELQRYGYINNTSSTWSRNVTRKIHSGDVLLATIKRVEKGFVIVSPREDSKSEYVVFDKDNSKYTVGNTCTFKVKDVANKQGTIEQVFGSILDPISENVAIATKYGFSTDFPQEVLGEASNVPQFVTDEQRLGRVNMEHIPFVTIDPMGCKDKDDAIYDEVLPNGDIKVYVAIADVSAVVPKGSKLEKEAFKRGNSCYLGGGVYPMFPSLLSNGICSLDEGKPRLAVVASAIVSKDGKFRDEKVELAVINVKKSYSYEEAEHTHNNENNLHVVNADTKDVLDTLYKNTEILGKRYKNVLRIDSHEPQYKFSEDRTSVEDITLSNQEYSHFVVETRMILANEIIATLFKKDNNVGIYRTHQKVQTDKLERLNQIIASCGIDFIVQNSNESFIELIEIIKQHPARDYLMNQITRALSRAQYKATEDETGHFGLAITSEGGYIHFTSPIRRYADFATHQMIKQMLLYGKTSVNKNELYNICEHINEQERKADSAENESDKYLACLWAQNHKDELHSGYISEIGDGFIVVTHDNGTVQVNIPTETLENGKKSPYKIGTSKMFIYNNSKTYTLGEKLHFHFGHIDLLTRMIYGYKDKVATKLVNNTKDNFDKEN